MVIDLPEQVEVMGQRNRPAFAPRITVCMCDGTTFPEKLPGNELEWDLATEVRRISVLFEGMFWPSDKLAGIVLTVSQFENLYLTCQVLTLNRAAFAERVLIPVHILLG